MLEYFINMSNYFQCYLNKNFLTIAYYQKNEFKA